MRQVQFLEDVSQDLRYGLRLIVKKPAFALVAMVTLALGIGANTAIFSLVSGVLLRPLPYVDPDRLVRLTEYYPKGAYVILRDQCQTMEVAAVWPGDQFNIAEPGRTPIRVNGSMVSGNLFSVLGASADRGRVFTGEENSSGKDKVVILSNALWQTAFAGDPGIIGRFITVEGESRQVVGVMPDDFLYPTAETKLWVPLNLDLQTVNDYWGPEMPILGRLRPGTRPEQARQEVQNLIPSMLAACPFPKPPNWNRNSTIISLQQDIVGDARGKFLILLGAVGLVLLMACANVANLLLARSATRRKEVAVRVALGASRRRIISQLLTESVLLSIGGAILGLLLASEGLALLKTTLPIKTPRLAEVAIDWRVLLFTGGLAILTGLLFGLAPAFNASKVNLVDSLNAGGRRPTGGATSRVYNALVVAEISLAAVLMIGAGLLITSLWLLSHTDPGCRSENILSVEVSPDKFFSKDRAQCLSFYDELLHRVSSRPGVESVAAINSLPLSGDSPVLPLAVEDYRPGEAEAQSPLVWGGAITRGYIETMGIPLLQGRTFTDDDRVDTVGVVLVSASTANRFWPRQDPLGRRLRLVWEKEWRSVVGVVADVKQYGLDQSRPTYLSGEIYMPYSQAVVGRGKFPASMNLIVHTTGDPVALRQDVKTTVAGLNPNVPVGEPRTMKQIIASSISTPNSTTWLFSTFSALALLLGAVGVYSLISYSVAGRTHEIGVRMALGATGKDVLKMIVGQGLGLTLMGIGFGLAAALVLTRFLASLLYNVKPIDPLSFIIAPVVLIITALLATYLPARRATKIDPMVALRAE
jgi:predicted permease